MTKYPTYFIRHTKGLKVDDSTLQRLRKQHKIAIHFPWTGNKKDYRHPDSRSINPSDYKKENARRALRSLKDLAESGGYVCAEFHDIEDCVLGFVRPHTKIRLFNGRWRTRDRKAILESLALIKVRTIPKANLVLILVCRPQQRTISKWHAVKSYVENFVTGKHVGPHDRFGSLLYGQQEVMCAEFLRSHDLGDGLPVLKYLLLPVGGQMKDIDIYGADTEGRKIIAQVTYDSLKKAKKKPRRLREYQNLTNVHLILFCNVDVQTERDGVVVVPLREVYDKFVRTDAGKAWQKDTFDVRGYGKKA
jgi:hypothetical protein